MNRPPQRVVVTGLGIVSSLALGREGTWSAMLEGKDGLAPLTRLSLPLEPAQLAGQVAMDPGRHQTLCERMALGALEEALDGLVPQGDPTRIGVFQGAGTSGLPVAEAFLEERLAGRRGRASEPAYQSPSTVTDALARRVGSQGPRGTIMNACSSSLLALGQAWERLAAGELDFAVAGGAENLCRTTYAGFSCLKAVDAKKCRPFSRDRAGLNLGEGAVQLVLETLDGARARGAMIYAEVLGYGASMDAHHPTAPHPEGEGAARAMTMALRTGGLDASGIDLVSAHGTATPANDGAECLAIRRALGTAADAISVTSTKSQFGHTLGAAGAFGAAAAILALRDQVVSPTLRLEEADPICDLDCTPKVAKQRLLRAALVNAFAFGGNNTSLLVRRWEGR
ncbi:MAG: beta-ketoacyl-[acyl-carrier-protein] synthase family protein [Geothrix sp.]|uniref:beta-ketoacyl-[acyl-carrier-protein] synthase family protein n=1 Tax=Geothrix sp. TaxID=1962974 RepID=UPI00185ED8CF|nr:beta-ketoacyl-[acyl-carrier-protein] synthase family protein [Geothrix sp.]NWJ40890.1 beta-ketoacyl-[acyl-carrier-protein] synthase family protein [Geothrix sp.]WIL21110.1 MAG: beta-ketoacyl-[acyl-carrier-protein] synthase family protein [Geothrix sp.]